MYLNRNDQSAESRWLTGEISSKKFLEESCQTESNSSLTKSVNATKHFEVPEVKSKAMAWAALEQRIATAEPTKTVPMYRQYWVGIAASLVLAVGAFFIFNQTSTNQTIITTSLAEVQTVYFPDGSVAYLNAGSEISFSKEEWQDKRTLKLKGEAFFEVNKGNEFTVETGLGKIIVLGTSFNVKERGGILEVACKSGRVKVVVYGSEAFEIITEGESVIVKEGEITTPGKIELTYIDNWRTGDFDFESVMLTQVFDELERQFGVELIFDENEIQDRPYTGYFDNKNLNEALQLVCNAMGLDFKIDKKKVTIMSKNAVSQ